MARDATARERDSLLDRRSARRLAGASAATVAMAGASSSADAVPSDTTTVPVGETETIGSPAVAVRSTSPVSDFPVSSTHPIPSTLLTRFSPLGSSALLPNSLDAPKRIIGSPRLDSPTHPIRLPRRFPLDSRPTCPPRPSSDASPLDPPLTRPRLTP